MTLSCCAGILVFARGSKSKKKVVWRPEDSLVEVSLTSLSYHDPDPYSVAFCIRMRYRYSMPSCIWIYIQWLSVLGSVFGIRIRVPKKCQLP